MKPAPVTELSPELVEKIAYLVANAKLGEGPAVRCEGPTEFEIDQARQWVRRVTAALNASTLVDENAMLREALAWIADYAARLRKGTGDWFDLTEIELKARTALSHKETNG